MEHLAELKQFLASPKKIVITTHQKPDADALGSSLGMAGYLKKLQHQVKIITPTDYPSFLFWMPGNEEVLVYDENKTHAETEKYFLEADLIVSLDFSDPKRIAPLDKLMEKSTANRLLLDHHIGNTHFAKYELWNVDAAATCELVYDFICLMEHQYLIDLPIAECIYAGIVTDTGSFKYESTSPALHRKVANLMELGLTINKIHRLIYDNNTEQRLRFLGFALSEKLRILPQYKTAYFVLTADDLKRFNSQTGDTEGLVNYALSIAGIRMATILIERADGIKMSFRSYGTLAVNEIASTYFNGGGHKNAAGGKLDVPLIVAEQKFLKILEEYKDILNQNG